MTESVHGSKEARDIYAKRGLESYFAKLKPYLFGGARVLDVGCGPGTITIDVAQAVHPGEIFGIDPSEESITHANQIKRERQIQNVTFQIGNVRALGFQDNEFDVVYAYAVFGWLAEPLKALAEMRRVTRKDGWVVITLPEEGALALYPPCPAYEKVLTIRQKYWTDRGDPDRYYDSQLGRRALELFKETGFRNISLEATPGTLRFAGEKPFNIDYDLMWLDYKGRGRDAYEKLFSLGVLDEETVIEAQNELRKWSSHPYASLIPRMGVTAAGQV